MGYTSYNTGSRNFRLSSFATENNFASYSSADGLTRSVDVVNDSRAFNAMFVQQAKGEIHESMSPRGLKFRECRDSVAHPNTVGIIVGLDVTGSMGRVPKQFIMEGLPTMMSTIIQRGTADASVCFVAIGDHEFDDAPIQVGQFESGDSELDMWLTRTWLEAGGGTNNGESYSLPWYVAARHTKQDSFEKRGRKGYLFTVGDEPVLQSIPASALRGIFGDGEPVQGTIKTADILAEAQQYYNVYHIALGERGKAEWKALLGQNYIHCDDYTKIPKMIAEIVYEGEKNVTPTEQRTIPVTGEGPVLPEVLPTSDSDYNPTTLL